MGLRKCPANRPGPGEHKGLQLAGNGFEGVGIPDCVRAGERAAEELLTSLDL